MARTIFAQSIRTQCSVTSGQVLPGSSTQKRGIASRAIFRPHISFLAMSPRSAAEFASPQISSQPALTHPRSWRHRGRGKVPAVRACRSTRSENCCREISRAARSPDVDRCHNHEIASGAQVLLRGRARIPVAQLSASSAGFRKAVALDTTFALAYYRMSIAAEWEGRTDLQSSSATNALRFSSRLTDHDKHLVKALVARRARDPDLAESIYRQIVREFPDDVEAWYHLGEVLFHDNAMRGRSFLESREAWAHVLKLVPNDADVLLHMIRVLSRRARVHRSTLQFRERFQ